MFRLQKTDLLDVLSCYPEAHANLKRKANELIKKRNEKALEQKEECEFDAIRVESVIKDRIETENTNKLADTVIQLIRLKRKDNL